MLISVESDEMVYATDLNLQEAIAFAKTLIERRGNYQYSVICGKDLCFKADGMMCFYFVSEEGFEHLHKDRKFKKMLRESLAPHLKCIRKGE